MSLLLDALKRAEQEKLARQAERAGEAADRSLPAARAGGLQLESLEPARGEGAAAPPTPAAAAPGDRANAQAIFAAKSERPASGAKGPVLVAVLVVTVLVIAGGAYVWFQINSLGPKPYAARPASAPAVKPIVPAASAEAPVGMPPAAPVPPPASGIPPSPTAAPPVALVRAEPMPPKKARPPPADAEKLVLGLLQDPASRTAAAPPLKLARSLEPAKVRPEITAGYEALRRGDLAAARRGYQAALAADPNGIDALLGLATVEARSDDRAAAARLYRKVLTLDAGNATALAGLAALADFTRPEALEASLKADIKRYPGSAALHMTLGNLYASQARWAEAQGAFFEAHRLEPQNPDALYNLAVALDNLNQARLAADYYRRALGLAKSVPVQFDARGAERRLAELKY